MQEVMERITQSGRFEVGVISMERAKEVKEEKKLLKILVEKMQDAFKKGIDQAAAYGRQLGLKEVVFLAFVELSQEEAKPLEQEVDRAGIRVVVLPVGVIF